MGKRLILDSPEPSAETLVQCLDSGRFRFELGGSSVGPSLQATRTQPKKNGESNPNKVISKLMVNRLKPFMDILITLFQNAFMRGRNISNNILIVHEIFDYLGKKKGRKHCFGALKVDMSKAYDRVDWKWLKVILTTMNFNASWVNWIMECVTTVGYTLLINGNLSHSFTPKKRLRQGDPLSPYLFLMCANILSLALMQEKNQKKIRGVKLGRSGIPLTHLFFTYDALLFFKHDVVSLSNIQHILNWYCSVSRQSINLSKSDHYCSPNMAKEVKMDLA